MLPVFIKPLRGLYFMRAVARKLILILFQQLSS